MTLIATVIALALPAPSCQSMVCEERVARHRCRMGDVPACITRAARRWRVSGGLLRRRAWCESRMNPRAYNASSGASGLFQFLPSTWRTTPYRRRSIWSAEHNAMAAAWMHHVGRGGEWACR
jgi:soluble lytic murein transglycosylase-like protein